MSTGIDPAAPAADSPLPPVAVLALAGELRRHQLVDSDEHAGIITEGELADLLGSGLTRTEITRIQRLTVLEMMGRGITPRDIRARLRLSVQRFAYLARGILADGIAEDKLDEMRAVEKTRLDWTEAEATRRYLESGKADFLKVRNECSDRRRRLFGLDKPVQVEMTTTRRVAIELEVISSREEYLASQAETEAHLDAIEVDALPPPPANGDANGQESPGPSAD
jgi:hypothetical protein